MNIYTHPQGHGLQIYTQFEYIGPQHEGWSYGPHDSGSDCRVLDKFVVWVKDPASPNGEYDSYYYATEDRVCVCGLTTCRARALFEDEKSVKHLPVFQTYQDLASRFLDWIYESLEFYPAKDFEHSLKQSLASPYYGHMNMNVNLVDTLIHDPRYAEKVYRLEGPERAANMLSTILRARTRVPATARKGHA